MRRPNIGRFKASASKRPKANVVKTVSKANATVHIKTRTNGSRTRGSVMIFE